MTKEKAVAENEQDGGIIDLTVEATTRKGTKTSKVWNDYIEVQGVDDKVMCKLCKRVLSATSSNGTSHLRRHLLNCPAKVNKDISQYMIKKSQGFDGTSTLTNHKYDENELRREIALMIVFDERPFSTVENVGFRRVMNKACPQFKMVGRKTITRDVIALYNAEEKHTRELLSKIPGCICLTSDTWKSCTEDHYVCVTAHFIDAEWKLQKRVIKFELIPPPYDGLSIGDIIISAMNKWKIESRVFSISLDNATVNDVVASNLRTHLLCKSFLPCNGAFLQVRCCCHILNLVVQAGYKVLHSVIVKLRLGIKYVRQNSMRRKNFKIMAKNLNLNVRKKLTIDCPTRWNSTYMMIESALYYKTVFLNMGMRDSNFTFNLSEIEWEQVAEMHDFLKLFYEVTKVFSGSKYPTSYLYFEGVWRVHCHLLRVVADPNSFMYDMVIEMQEKFNKYWSDYSLILSCGAILDPRHKVRLVEYCFTKLYGDGADGHVANILNTLTSLFDAYVKNDKSSGNTQESNMGYVVKKGSSVFGMDDAFDDYDNFQGKRAKTQHEKSELDLYLEELSVARNCELDILDYWKGASMKYPVLAKMARDILSIPVSTVASECTFSTGRRIISYIRSCLKPDTVEALICLQDWMRAYNREGFVSPNDDSYCTSSSSSDDDS